MVLAEAPDGVRLPGDPTGPSALCNGVGDMALLTAFSINIGLLAMVNQKDSIRSKYLLNPVIDNLHFRGVVLVTLVNLPIDIQDYEVRGRLLQKRLQGYSVLRFCDNTREFKRFGVRHENIGWQYYARPMHLLQPIPPDQLGGIELDIEYTTTYGNVEAHYWFPSRHVDGQL